MKLKVGQKVIIVNNDVHAGKVVTISSIQGTACYGKCGETVIGFKMSEAELVKENIGPVSR